MLKFILIIACLVCISSKALALEIGLDLGVNKVAYTPFYRTFSEEYNLSFQSDITWDIFLSNNHQIKFGSIVQLNFQEIIGNQLNIAPVLRYKFSFLRSFFAEFQVGYGIQILLPRRAIYQQNQSGEWENYESVFLNQLIPTQISFGKNFENHSFQMNYSYQMIFGFNTSVNVLPIERWSLAYRYILN